MNDKLFWECVINHNINEKQIKEVISHLNHDIESSDEEKFLNSIGLLADFGVRGLEAAKYYEQEKLETFLQ